MASDLLILGEAPGQEEILAGKPFVGPSGQELARMFRDAGLPVVTTPRLDIDRDAVAVTNVFTNQPPRNNLEAWCVKKDEARVRYAAQRPALVARFPDFPWPESYTWSALTPGGYLDPIHLTHLPRLASRIAEANPKLILALGNTPLWALTNERGITKARGVVGLATQLWSGKFLATYHPAAILRAYNLRSTAVVDLIKAKAELAAGSAITYKSYDLIILPTKEEVLEFIADIQPGEHVAPDIETSRGMVTCVGFATRRLAICIPILRLDYSLYWGEDTSWALNIIAGLLALSNPKVFQNGMYDAQYLWRVLGMPIQNFNDDTMLLHHTLQPELPKSLAFLASVYTQASTWKELSKLAKFKFSEGKKDD